MSNISYSLASSLPDHFIFYQSTEHLLPPIRFCLIPCIINASWKDGAIDHTGYIVDFIFFIICSAKDIFYHIGQAA